MKPRHERLNERLEAPSLFQRKQFRSPLPGDQDPEMEELLGLAQYLHTSPDFKTDSTFAQELEQAVIAHTSQQQAGSTTRRRRFFTRSVRMQLACAVLLIGLLLALGTVMAAQVPSAASPFSFLKHLVPHPPAVVNATATETPQEQAEASLQQAREQLNTLVNLANPAHATAYQQALTTLRQQIDNTSGLIDALPYGAGQTQLSKELSAFKDTARHTLHGLLYGMTLSERLVTTDALHHLGETMPVLTRALMITTLFPQKQAIITLIGTNLSPGAQVVVDDRVFANAGTFQPGTYVFIIPWSGTRSPGTIALLNADGTLVQTTAITFAGQNSGGGSLPTIPTIPPLPTVTPPAYP